MWRQTYLLTNLSILNVLVSSICQTFVCTAYNACSKPTVGLDYCLVSGHAGISKHRLFLLLLNSMIANKPLASC